MVSAWPRAVLFDLDGTLIDSAPDLAAATNELLANHGLAPLSVADVRKMIGEGVGVLVERAFAARGRPLVDAALRAAIEEMGPIYGRHLIGLTTATPGAMALLQALRAEGRKLAVVTNKPSPALLPILDHFGFSPLLDGVVGGDDGLPKKPAPAMLLAAAQRLGCDSSDCVMVGDGAADVSAAHAASMKVVALRGGYGATPAESLAPDAAIDGLNDLPAVLESLSSAAR